MLTVSSLGGWGRTPGAVTEVSMGSTAFDGTDSNNTPSFSGMTFGPAAANRYVFAVVGTGDSVGAGGTTAVTIGGQSATEIIEAPSSGVGGGFFTSIWVALVTSGTTGTVAITHVSGAHGTGVSTLYAYGIDTTATDTQAAYSGGIVSSLSVTADIPTGGFIIACCHENTGTQTHTWTNATEVSDDYGSGGGAGSQGGPRGIAADNESSAVTGRTITVALSVSRDTVMATASFQAA